jgi:tetratricopeptide (TPR) repeat protein
MTLAQLGRFEKAIEEVKRAAGLDPLSVMTNAVLCWVYWFARQNDQLMVHAKRTVDLHPDVPHSHWPLGIAYQEAGNFDAAIAEMRLAVENTGGATTFLAMLSETYARTGHRDEAQQVLRQMKEHSNQQYVTPYMIGLIHAALRHNDEALQWLETAYNERAAWIAQLKRDPGLDSLRSDRRYEALVGRINYPS